MNDNQQAKHHATEMMKTVDKMGCSKWGMAFTRGNRIWVLKAECFTDEQLPEEDEDDDA